MSFKIIVAIYIVFILNDIILFCDLRKLIYSFLLSKRNRKGAKKIHLEQSTWARFTLSYIKDYAVYPKEYAFFHGLYKASMIWLLPQYMILTLVAIFWNDYFLLSAIIFGIIKIILCIIVGLQFNANRISRFDKRY